MTWWQITLIIYLIITLPIFVGFLVGLSADYLILFKTPKDLYESTEMNWFGCIFVWFLEFLLNPFAWIGVAIAIGVYWLFTVGRK